MEDINLDIYDIANFQAKELSKERKNNVLSRHLLERWLDFHTLDQMQQVDLYRFTREHLKKIGWVG